MKRRHTKDKKKEILQLIARGWSSEDIALKCRVSKESVINLAKKIDYHQQLIWLEEYANELKLTLEEALTILIRAEQARVEKEKV